jgi:serine/threonine-protein kinase
MRLAFSLDWQGRYDEAREWAMRGLETTGEESSTAEAIRLAEARSLLAGIEMNLGDLAEAERLEREALVVLQEIFGDDHPATLGKLNNLATLLKNRGDFAGSGELLVRVLEAQRATLGEEHPFLASIHFNLGEAQLLDGRTEQALASYDEAVRLAEAQPEAIGPLVGILTAIRGRALLEAGRPDEAAQAFTSGLALLDESPGAAHPLTARILVEYAALLNDLNRPAEAAEVVARARPVLESAYPKDSRELALLHLQSGRSLSALSRLELARDSLQRARDILRASPFRGRYERELRQAEELLAALR